MAGHGTLKWFLAMAALIAILAGGTAWIVQRDWLRPDSVAAEREQAQVAARRLLTALQPDANCTSCSYRVIAKVADQHWRVGLRRNHWRACFVIDLEHFKLWTEHGIAGVRRTRCQA